MQLIGPRLQQYVEAFHTASSAASFLRNISGAICLSGCSRRGGIRMPSVCVLHSDYCYLYLITRPYIQGWFGGFSQNLAAGLVVRTTEQPTNNLGGAAFSSAMREESASDLRSGQGIMFSFFPFFFSLPIFRKFRKKLPPKIIIVHQSVCDKNSSTNNSIELEKFQTHSGIILTVFAMSESPKIHQITKKSKSRIDRRKKERSVVLSEVDSTPW